MPYLKQRASGIWYIRDTAGGDRWISTGTRTRREADTQLGDYLRGRHASQQIAPHAGGRGSAEPLPIRTLGDAVVAYLGEACGHLAAASLRNEREYWNRRLPQWGGTPLASIDTAWLQRIAIPRDRSARTQTLYGMYWHKLLRHAVRRGWIESNPAAGLARPRQTRARHPDWLSPTEYALLCAWSPPWLLPIVVLGCHTGLRPSELRQLRWPDVDLAHAVARIRPETNKLRAGRTIPLNAACVALLAALPHHSDPVVLRNPDGTPLDRVIAEAGVKPEPAHALADALAAWSRERTRARLLTPYALRHTFGTWLACGLVGPALPLPQLQALMGHARISTTMQYVHVSASDLTGATAGLATATELRPQLRHASKYGIATAPDLWIY